jgi:hypothetical protein
MLESLSVGGIVTFVRSIKHAEGRDAYIFGVANFSLTSSEGFATRMQAFPSDKTILPVICGRVGPVAHTPEGPTEI